MTVIVEAVHRSTPLMISAILLSLVACFIFIQNSSKFPTHGARGILAAIRFNQKGHIWMTEGYTKFAGRIFQVWSRHGMIHIIPAKYLKELQKLPESTLHFESIAAVTSPEYTGFVTSPLQTEFLTHHLIPSLGSLRQILFNEAKYAIAKEISCSEEWTSINLFGRIQRVVACTNLFFVSGPELNRDPEWLKTIIEYVFCVSMSDAYLKLLPAWLRPFAFKLMPMARRLKRCEARGREQFEARHIGQAKKANDDEIGTQNFADWLAERLPVNKPSNLEYKLQLSFGFAAIHTVNSALNHLIQDLAASSELVEILREELSIVSLSQGEFWKNDGLSKLVKMDSFMKESQRIFPVSQIASIRLIKKDIALDDGQTLLTGQKCVGGNSAISMDPELYKEPDKFDPLRFYKMRFSGSTEKVKYKFTSLTHEMLPFGYGRHACPGRFLAHDTIKITLGLLLQNYDFRLPAGETKRPSPLRFGHAIIPNPWAAIEIRSRAADAPVPHARIDV